MFAVRLPGVLAGLALLLAVYQVGRKVGLSKAAALISVGALLATAVFYFNARRPMMDVPGTALGMWAFVCLLTPSKGTWRSAIIGGVLLGLAALTKFVAPIPFVIALIMLQFFSTVQAREAAFSCPCCSPFGGRTLAYCNACDSWEAVF